MIIPLDFCRICSPGLRGTSSVGGVLVCAFCCKLSSRLSHQTLHPHEFPLSGPYPLGYIQDWGDTQEHSRPWTTRPRSSKRNVATAASNNDKGNDAADAADSAQTKWRIGAQISPGPFFLLLILLFCPSDVSGYAAGLIM